MVGKHYTPHELEQLLQGVKGGVNLSGLEVLLERTAFGIVKKLRCLSKKNPQR